MADVWKAPGADGGPPSADADAETVRRGLGPARAVGALLIAAGVVVGTQAAQVLVFAYAQTLPVLAAELGSAGVAVGLIVSGARVFDASPVWCLIAAGIAALGAVGSMVWGVVLILDGALSLLSVLGVVLMLASAAGSVAMIPVTVRVAEARGRLEG